MIFTHEPQDKSLDFYRLSPPDQDAMDRRQQRVDELKQAMGDRWLLAQPVQRMDRA